MRILTLVLSVATAISTLSSGARAGELNAYGVTYETQNVPEGAVRAGSWRSYPIQLNTKASSQTVKAPNAAFVKVYFDYLDLPSGWQLQVSNADGSEAYRYGGSEASDFTFDTKMGQNGSTSFAAMSISGDTAVVSLLPPSTFTQSKAQPYVVISHILEGFPEQVMEDLKSTNLLLGGGLPAPDSICGTDNKQRPACYSGNAFDKSRAVARLLIGGTSLCTAWRIGAGDKMLTNNHCASSNADVAATEVWFNYQHSGCTGTGLAAVTKVSGKTMLKTSGPLDYTLFTINNAANVASFGTLSIDPRMPNAAEQIYIPQHPGGRFKEIAVNSTSDSTGKCKVFATQVGNDFTYYCDTEGGSSGSPVFSASNNKVIGLHHLGGCTNRAVRISRVWQEIGGFFNNQVP